MILNPRSVSGGFIYTYRLVSGGEKLEFVHKAEVIVNYHVGETVLSLQKTTLIPGGSESMVYTTLSGGIGILVPFTSHEDHDFFQHLEMHMRSE
ncbi:splicing factor 3B subunit 3-like [Pseudoliparis swirei]|uniref:splicing factor 3B subunit 3-like n=1 Tax=Pseudoliparis swirei TaxID=2059687 RepID=UPI0024BEEE8C|nr:splicing factor 3B subunit 3-like [Pseudoliparis swirei]